MHAPTPDGVGRTAMFECRKRKSPNEPGLIHSIMKLEITGRNRAAYLRRVRAQRRSNAGLRRTG